MNYQKNYELLINKAKFEKRKKLKKNDKNYVYYEKHHIIPKCVGGTNNDENLVLLTAREHYICHKLLTYIYKRNKKISNAFCRMTWDKNGKRNISSKDYAYAKELKSSIPMSDETRNKMRKPKGPMSLEHKMNLSKSGKGRIRSKESIEKQKKTSKGKPRPWLRGKPSWNKGITMSDEFRLKLSIGGKGISRNKGKKLTDKQKEHLRIINTGKKQSRETIEKRRLSMGNPWNKGLTKETDERLKLAGIKESKTKNNG